MGREGEVSGDFSDSDDLGSPSGSDSELGGRESPETAAIMQQMDHELATTEVGKSFEKATVCDSVHTSTLTPTHSSTENTLVPMPSVYDS